MSIITSQRGKYRESIRFKDKRSNFTQKQTGERVGDHLIVGLVDRGNGYAIFGVDGKLFINCSFKDYDACVSVAILVDELFDPYFPILEVHPNADVLALAKWSVHRGIRVYEFTLLLEDHKKLTKEEVEELWDQAKENTNKWRHEHIR